MHSLTFAPALGALNLAAGTSGGLVLLIVTILVAVGFDFTNGFHDTANAVATSISTRVLTPWFAIVMAAVLNFLGAFISTNVAKTIGTDVAAPASLTPIVVLSALLAAITWNLITWYYGLPSSSTHALLGGLIGAAVVLSPTHFTTLKLAGIIKVVLSLILSPIAGMVLAFIVATVVVWLFRGASPHRVTATSSWLQRLSAAFVAFSHGSNDAQKTMGVITAALLTYQGAHVGKAFAVPIWVIVLSATAMGLGTSFGGWRIIRTMGMRTVKLKPLDGFAAESASAAVILAGSNLGLPVSTTHVITGSIMGVGARQRISAVRWGVAGNMVTAWILTGPITAILAAAVVFVLHAVTLI